MKASVDPYLCSGCDQCPDMCPSVFELRGQIAHSHSPKVPALDETCCQEAANACPNQAIEIEHE